MPDLDADAAFLRFWAERHLCVLATVDPGGTLHQVPVGATYDAETGIARIITDAGSIKVRNVLDAGTAARASLCQVDGRRWSTLVGLASVNRARSAVLEAERRYTSRYRTPRANPNRVVIEIRVEKVLGTVRPTSAGPPR